MTAEDLIDGEEELVRLWEAGEIPFLTHFSGGNELELIKIFRDIKPTDWVFASHRAHYHARLHGMSQEQLKAEVLAGRSMFLYMKRFICSAIVAGTASIAAGAALAIKMRGGTERVHCFIGDAGTEEGHWFEAVQFVQWRDLPCHFYIEDNNISCGVTQEQRRGSDWDWTYPSCVTRYKYKMTLPHAGTWTRPQLKWKP